MSLSPNKPTVDICVVVNAHREGLLLTPTLRSVARARQYACERGIDVEILIVLDSPDAITAEVAESFIRAHGAWRGITVDFGDLGASRNAAIASTEAKAISFIDGDDLWSSDWLFLANRLAASEERMVALHPEFNLYFGGENPFVWVHVDMDHPEFNAPNLLFQNFWTSAVLAKREVFSKISYPISNMAEGIGYEDWTWNCNFVSEGGIHKVVPSTTHFVRQKSVSLLTIAKMRDTFPAPHNLFRYLKGVHSRK